LTTVAIIGAGPLGRWLALSAARAGFRVLLEDVMPANLHHAQEVLRGELGPEYFAEQLGAGAKAHALSGGFVPGLKPPPPSGSSLAEEHASGAKAQVGSCDFVPGMNPWPTAGGQDAGPVRQAQGRLSISSAFKAPKSKCGSFDSPPHRQGPVAGDPGSAEKRFAQDDSQGGAADSAQDGSVFGVAFVSTIEDAVRDADLAIDCVPDELESKLEILWLLDRMAPPRTVLATPTTRLSIADLANCTYRPDKCVAIAVEASSLAAGLSGEILLRTTSRTTAETLELVEGFWRRLGFAATVELDREQGTGKRDQGSVAG
jgi:3-hydroxybutyryl-CoA dehydrogenase